LTWAQLRMGKMEKERLKSEAGRLERLTGMEKREVFRGNGGRRGMCRRWKFEEKFCRNFWENEGAILI